MSENNSIGALAAALAKAQTQYKPLHKSQTARVGQYSYDYATLADVLDSVLPALNANEIAVLQPASLVVSEHGTFVQVKTVLVHSSGEAVESSLMMPCAEARPQAVGSAITYGRRYSLCSLVGIAADEDDDANEAQGQKAEIAPKVYPPKAAAAARKDAAAGGRLKAYRDKVEMLANEMKHKTGRVVIENGKVTDEGACGALQADPPVDLSTLNEAGMIALGKYLAQEIG